MVNERDFSGAERRSGRRTGLRRPCTLLLPGAESRLGMTVDVGLDGLSLYTAKPVAAGTRCELHFELPGQPDASFRAAAKVVYSSYSGSQGFKIGAIFMGLDARTTAALLAFSDR